ncbi:MAG TPA: sigma-70 family RNA polymerase sigma factor, partial [Variovorax sp.]
MPEREPALSDDQLMLAYADGDSLAFDSLYARHEKAMLRFVRRMLGLRLAGEADEVFRAIWQRIVDERDEFAAQEGLDWRFWAFKFAHGLVRERLRLSGREADFHAHDEDEDEDADGRKAAMQFSRGLLRDGASPAAEDEELSDEELAFWNAAGRRLLACLEVLPEDQRAAFLLYQEEGFTVEALAGALGVEEESVRNRLRKARGHLRECLERYLSVLGEAQPDEGDAELDDAQLDRVLDFAPDLGAVPAWSLGEALREKAHEALNAGGLDEPLPGEEPGSGRRSRRWIYGGVAAALVLSVAGWLLLRQPVHVVRVEASLAA